MSSRVARQDSFDSVDSDDSVAPYVPGDLLEAPTLSAKEMQRAREQALKALQAARPSDLTEEAKKTFFSQGTGGVKFGDQLRRKPEGAATTKPPEAADGKKPGVGVQPPPKN